MNIYILIIVAISFSSSILSVELHKIKVDNKIGFIDSNGNVIIEPVYEGSEIYPFSNSDISYVYLNKKCGYINKKNVKIIDFRFHECSIFYDNYAIVIDEMKCINNEYDYRKSVIDKSGNIIFSIKDRDLVSYSEGFFVYNLDKEKGCGGESESKTSTGRYGLLDKNGKEIKDLQYDYISGFKNGLSIVNLKGKYGIIDTKFKIVFPLEYEYISPFVSGYATIKLNGESATINEKLEIVIPFGRFFSIWGFYDNFALACKHVLPKNKKKIKCTNVIIDTKGNIIFEETKEIKYLSYFSEGLAKASNKNNYQGFIDKSFTWVIKPKFYSVGSFQNGLAEVYITQTDFWKHKPVYINKNGKIIWKQPDL